MNNLVVKGKAVLLLDQSEDLKNTHVVHFMAVFGSRSLFLKSMYIGDTRRDSQMHAEQAQIVIYAYERDNYFSPIASKKHRAALTCGT